MVNQSLKAARHRAIAIKMETALTGVGRLANKSPCYKLAAWIAAITADKSLSRSTIAAGVPDSPLLPTIC